MSSNDDRVLDYIGIDYGYSNQAHYHRCPECYEYHNCVMNCTIEPDMGTYEGKPFSSS